jgi:TPR repeat protein
MIYRVDHPTWPVLCTNSAFMRMFPRLDWREDDRAICHAYAERGDAVMQTEVAEGRFGPVSPAERAAWLARAADQDYGPALTALAAMLGPFTADQGVPKDIDRAVRLYTRAAEQGDVLSQVLLAVLYHRGKGVPQDSMTWLMWEEIAAATAEAHPGPMQLRNLRKTYDRSVAKSPPDQVAEAHRRAQEFLAKHR